MPVLVQHAAPEFSVLAVMPDGSFRKGVIMFGLFQSKKTKLEKKYAKLLEEAHKLSHVSRAQSDLKSVEAEEVLDAIKEMEGSTSGD